MWDNQKNQKKKYYYKNLVLFGTNVTVKYSILEWLLVLWYGYVLLFRF